MQRKEKKSFVALSLDNIIWLFHHYVTQVGSQIFMSVSMKNVCHFKVFVLEHHWEEWNCKQSKLLRYITNYIFLGIHSTQFFLVK